MSSASSSPSASPARTRVLVPPERTTIFPPSRAAALLQAVCFHKPEGIAGYWTPTPADLVGVEDQLEEYLANEGRAPRDNWAEYRRQVAGIVLTQTRAIFLSYFVPEPTVNRPSEDANGEAPYWMNDGGDTYFRVVYDPSRKAFTWYERNSEP